MIRSLFVAGVCVALLGAAPLPLSGQQYGALAADRSLATRYFDYFVQRPLEGAGTSSHEGGVGGRIMWQLAGITTVPLHPQVERTALGAYLVHLPDDTDRSPAWRFGTQADIPLVRAPLAGRIDPFVSLGIGALRVIQDEPEETGAAEAGVRTAAGEAPFPPRSLLEVAPGVGARIRLMPGLELRGDLRRTIEVRDGADPYLELAGGLSFRL